MNNNVREFREKAELTQFELAMITRIAPSDICQVEKGKRLFPKWKKKIAEALGKTESEVFPEVQGVKA